MANRTNVVATIALETCSIALIVASFGESFSYSIKYKTRSTTTIASSTTRPMANTKPNSVSIFRLKPRASITANVANNDTGMVRVGIRVERQSCKKT